jgi:hypothetical protein
MVRLPLFLVAALLLASGCGSDDGPPALPQRDDAFELDPANFVAEIDNPWWPMRPGSRWVYRETDPDGANLEVVVTVTRAQREVAGIKAVVVHDVVREEGDVIEDTYDWYAQDKWGNVWYLGEDTKELENGKVVSTEGSWEAGVDGAQAGVVVPAEPRPGLSYRQEHYAGHAEDEAEVLRLDAQVRVPFGSFRGALQTKDTTPLEPGLVEHKYYARDIGPVLAVAVSSGGGREELISFTPGR